MDWHCATYSLLKLNNNSFQHCLAARLRSRDRNTPDYIFYIDFSISDLYSDIYRGDGIETTRPRIMHMFR